ncbi:MAG: tRNA1(Val) (adenine(37)-N6)-methyltransferase [Phenylobacterium sp.]|uniref:tRNA1(Val) (adenine(37)-N6)-methyltransferase n=1 Tax=Phenylobacterium sp. TaxID=1871053 RepID=UPI00391D6F9B
MTDTTLRQNDAGVTEDRLLDGNIVLRQPRKGYRAGLDALLLAGACDAAAGARVIEAGCGVGGALLCAARLREGASFTGVERDEAAVALARENAALNGLEARVHVVQGDVAQPFRRLGLEPFDAAMANPPFFDDPRTLRAPDPAKRGAWIAEEGLAAWIAFLLKAVREGGTLTLIHRADRLADILGLLSPKAGSIQVRPVQPFADAPAKRVLVRAVKTGRAPLALLPPLVLHARGETAFLPAADAILRGAAPLPWGPH